MSFKSGNNSNLETIRCCNPFKKAKHRIFDSKNLRTVTKWMCDINETICEDMKVCNTCRLELGKLKTRKERENQEMEEDDPDYLDTDAEDLKLDIILDHLNKSLEILGYKPIKKHKISSSVHVTQKLKVLSTFFEKYQSAPNEEICSCETLMNSLKTKFQMCESTKEKMRILTLVPSDWSASLIQKKFNTTKYMAEKAKNIIVSNEMTEEMTLSSSKKGKTLNEEVALKVRNFYSSDEISRVMPGKKDYVSIRDHDVKIQVQKRLLLSNLKEIYAEFKRINSQDKVGLSKFCELRPKNCVFAGSSGTHSVCVCVIHQNTKLMIKDTKLFTIRTESGDMLKSYQNWLAILMCNPSREECFFNNCPFCPGKDMARMLVQTHFDEHMIDEVIYKQWIYVDRCNIETIVKNSDEFIEIFLDQLIKLKKHSFIAKEQTFFYNWLKENLEENELVVNCDFAENYQFVIQDEVQSFHWNKRQCTLHPVIAYGRRQGKLEHYNFVVISENLKHDTVAVHLFQSKIIPFLKNECPNLKKIYYFSDGCAAQYKNKKNFVNICNHQKDFGVEAEWHYFATAHGKSVCDGLGGTVKRIAAKASLQRPDKNHIITAKDLYEFAKININSINFIYCEETEHNQHHQTLEKRFSNARTTSGTQQFHCAIPLSSNVMCFKTYSQSSVTSINTIIVE